MLKLGMMSEAKIAYHSMSIQDTIWICEVSYQSGFFTNYSLFWLLPLNLAEQMLKHLTTSRAGTSRFGECGHIQINGRASFTSGDVAADVG